jgi:hypothetical protein
VAVVLPLLRNSDKSRTILLAKIFWRSCSWGQSALWIQVLFRSKCFIRYFSVIGNGLKMSGVLSLSTRRGCRRRPLQNSYIGKYMEPLFKLILVVLSRNYFRIFGRQEIPISLLSTHETFSFLVLPVIIFLVFLFLPLLSYLMCPYVGYPYVKAYKL